jgi:putative transposase
LPYSPYQNGKQEVFFCQIEGRLLPMMEKFKELDLNILNKATHAWLEGEYNSSVHSEIKTSPRKRFMESKSVGRNSPDMEKLEQLFCIEETRRVRKSDSTVTILSRRFDLPHRFLHHKEVNVRFASWAPNKVWLVSDDTVLCRLWPENLEKKADSRRKMLPISSEQTELEPKPEAESSVNEFAPLLKKYMERQEFSGLPPAFMPLAGEDEDE